MHRPGESQPDAWVASLRGFIDAREEAEERCELCGSAVGADHEHLVEKGTRRLLCACLPCGMLFTDGETGKFLRVPRDVVQLHEFRMSDPDWETLMIPIDIAFFFRRSSTQRVLAMYPGPGGAVESALALETWEDLAAANPVLRELEHDVEALLVNRRDGAREYYRVPIDRCYRLVGEIRRHWRGISGGDQVRGSIGDFFENLRAEASPHA